MLILRDKVFPPQYLKVLRFLLASVIFTCCVAIGLFIIGVCMYTGRLEWEVVKFGIVGVLTILFFAYVGYPMLYKLIRFTCWIRVNETEIVIKHPFLFRKIRFNAEDIQQYGYGSTVFGRYAFNVQPTLILVLKNNKRIEIADLFQSDFNLFEKFVKTTKAKYNEEIFVKEGWWKREIMNRNV